MKAGDGSSLAARTSDVAVLVAATSLNPRTLVVELVGVTAERRNMAIADSAGIISHISIDTARAAGSGPVTTIRVSLARAARHRVRIARQLVYVDFEEVRPETAIVAVRRPPAVPKPAPSRPTPSASPAPGALERPAAAIAAANPKPSPAESAGSSALSRWLTVFEPLQHAFDPPAARTVPGRAWMPIVLKDGRTIFSHGDYSEVDGHLAFFLPFEDSDTPHVEAVAVPASSIDLDATNRAAESVRAARYALTRGPAEFAEFSDTVSAALNAVPLEADPLARVRLVEDIRNRLVEWPAAHHGYRARDVLKAVGILDPILNQLRAAAGVNRVDLNLSATADVQRPVLAFRQPSLVDLLENAIRFVSLTAPARRSALLRTTADSLERQRPQLPALWFSTTQRRVAAALRSESRLDGAYRELTTTIVERASRAARDGNVRAIESLKSDLAARDEELGRMRPDIIASALTALQAEFERAARERLRRDGRTIERPSRAAPVPR